MSKQLENLLQKALVKGIAKINGRINYGYGEKSELQEKYKITFNGDIVELYHWQTLTLSLNTKTKKIISFYGKSASDRDSMNFLAIALGFNINFSYYSSIDLFAIVTDKYLISVPDAAGMVNIFANNRKKEKLINKVPLNNFI